MASAPAKVVSARAERLSETVRTARLNELCYGRNVARLSSWNFGLEVFIAVCSSTAVGSWAIWHNEVDLGIGQIVWRVLSALLVIATIVKPLLKLSDRLKLATERVSEWHSLYVEALALADDIRANDGFYADDVLSHEALLAKKLTAIEQKCSEEAFESRVEQTFKTAVDQQYPRTYFWFPKDASSDAGPKLAAASADAAH